MHLHCKILRSRVTGTKTQDGYTPGPQNDWLFKSQSLENHAAHSAPHDITARVQRVTDAQGKGGSPHTPLPWGPIPTPIHRPAPASCKVTYPLLIRTRTALPPSPCESPLWKRGEDIGGDWQAYFGQQQPYLLDCDLAGRPSAQAPSPQQDWVCNGDNLNRNSNCNKHSSG